MNKIKNHPYMFARIIILFTLGLLFLFIKPQVFMNFIYFVVGSILMFNGLIKICMNSHLKNEIVLVEGVLNVIIGLSIILFNHFILTIVLSLIFLVFPLVRIFHQKIKKQPYQEKFPLL